MTISCYEQSNIRKHIFFKTITQLKNKSDHQLILSSILRAYYLLRVDKQALDERVVVHVRQ